MPSLFSAVDIHSIKVGSSTRRGSVQHVIGEAWTNDNQRRNQFLDEFRWLFWGMRAALRFPYCTNAKGELEIKFLSLSFFYWAVAYSIMLAINVENVFALLEKLMTEDMEPDQGVKDAYSAGVLLFITVYPGSFVREFRNMALFVNKWSDFEEAYERGVGSPLKFKYTKVNSFAKWAMGPSVVVMTFATINALFWSRWYSLVAIIVICVACFLMLMYWVLGAYELCHVGWNMKQKIIVDFCSDKRVTAEEVRDLRLAWLELKVTIKRFADSVSYIFTYLLLMVCSVFIMSAFANVSILASGRFEIGLTVIMLVAAGFLVGINDCGHRLTSSAGKEICETLPRANLKTMDPGAVEELKLFMKVIRMNYPVVSFGGMIEANRSTVTSMISVTVTYLIVLLQFQTADIPPVATFLANATYTSAK